MTYDFYQNLLKLIPAREYPVRNILVGSHWTLVSSRFAGLASTLTGEGPHGHERVRDVGKLHNKSANELAEWILSKNLTEASIGLAALNSLLEIDETRMTEINAAEVIAGHSAGRNLAIVGHFPFIERMQTIAKNCWVLEKRPAPGDYPESAGADLLPRADVVAITGTAIINHTMPGLLALCKPGALVLVLGPSAPLVSFLFNYGVQIISGSKVVDEAEAALTIGQGAIFPQVRGVKLLTLARDETHL